MERGIAQKRQKRFMAPGYLFTWHGQVSAVACTAFVIPSGCITYLLMPFILVTLWTLDQKDAGNAVTRFPLSDGVIKQETECDMLDVSATQSLKMEISDCYSMSVTGGQSIEEAGFCGHEAGDHSLDKVLESAQYHHKCHKDGVMQLDASEAIQQLGLFKSATALENIGEDAGWPLTSTGLVIAYVENMDTITGHNLHETISGEEKLCPAPEAVHTLKRYEQCEDLVTVKECQLMNVDFVFARSLNKCSMLNAQEKSSNFSSSGPDFTESDSTKAHKKVNTIQSQSDNKEHMRILHTDMRFCDWDKNKLPVYKRFMCDDCGRKYARMKQIKTHMTTHTGQRPYVCDVCGIGCSKLYCLKRHMRIHTGEKPFQCELCTRSFSDKSNLMSHRRKHVEVEADSLETGAGESGLVSVQAHRRKAMGMKLESQVVRGMNLGSVSVKAYRRKHTKVKVDTGSVYAIDSDCVNDLEIQRSRHMEEKPFECDFCGMRFACLSHLKPHRRIHTGEKPHKCEFCGKKFSCISNLTGHRRIHTGEKPFQCDICGVSFAFSSSLKTHRRKHTGEKPFKCDVCGMCFVCSSSMTSHKRTHDQENPYKCEFCGLSCPSSSHLQLHKRIHTGERPFICEICQMSFVSATHLKTHKRIHTGEKPFKCEFCCTRFVSSGQLKSHRRTHTGERPFKCEFCTKAFSHKCSLMNHRRIHTGEKPYSCDVCGMCFPYANAMELHKRKHR